MTRGEHKGAIQGIERDREFAADVEFALSLHIGQAVKKIINRATLNYYFPTAEMKKERDYATPIIAYSLSKGYPVPVSEYRFAPPRKWLFDFAWVDAKIALEIEGGVWSGGRHTRPKGFLGDIEKYNAAALAGWRLIRITPEQLTAGDLFPILDTLFGAKPCS